MLVKKTESEEGILMHLVKVEEDLVGDIFLFLDRGV